MPSVIAQRTQIPVGSSLPAHLPHAVSVSLPKWSDNVAYEEGEDWIKEAMQTGYPRFFIHKSIQKLASICLKKFGHPDELCILLPSPRGAQQCRSFILHHSSAPVPVRIVEFAICPSISSLVPPGASGSSSPAPEDEVVELQIVLFPSESFPLAKAFWQHAGEGISSRRAERGLALLGETPGLDLGKGNGAEQAAIAKSVEQDVSVAKPADPPARASYSKNRHYSRAKPSAFTSASSGASTPAPISATSPTAPLDPAAPDLNLYVEQRYGRNLPLASAAQCKVALRRRIAGVLEGEEVQGRRIQEHDVFLYPTGMNAIYHAHLISMAARKGDEKKSVCFGFPYTDTLKVLQKFGPGAHFFGLGLAPDLQSLRELCLSEQTPENPRPIQAVFTEFPSNPLLRTADLRELRALADEFGFFLVVDETVGNFVNVEVSEWADIVVSSLTKVFSGEPNVMGGSLILNPSSRNYSILRECVLRDYEDNYFSEDAVFMERNSRDFIPRIGVINTNAEHVCDLLHARSLASASSSSSSVIKEVFYPKWQTSPNYLACRRPLPPPSGPSPNSSISPSLTSPEGFVDASGRYGGLFSVTFTSSAAASAFFDALPCAKGPSLGTNFTLASPYTILAHYTELEWADSFGVSPWLVRVSVGMEDKRVLERWFSDSAEAAEKAGAEEAARQTE